MEDTDRKTRLRTISYQFGYHYHWNRFIITGAIFLEFETLKRPPFWNKMADKDDWRTRLRTESDLIAFLVSLKSVPSYGGYFIWIWKFLNDRHFKTRWQMILTNKLCWDLYKICLNTKYYWNRFIITGIIMLEFETGRHFETRLRTKLTDELGWELKSVSDLIEYQVSFKSLQNYGRYYLAKKLIHIYIF